MTPSDREPRIVAYSKNAPFEGGKGYVLWEYPGHWMSATIWVPVRHRKVPMPEFLRLMLK